MQKGNSPAETGFPDAAEKMTDEQVEKVSGGIAPPLPPPSWQCRNCQTRNPWQAKACSHCGASKP